MADRPDDYDYDDEYDDEYDEDEDYDDYDGAEDWEDVLRKDKGRFNVQGKPPANAAKPQQQQKATAAKPAVTSANKSSAGAATTSNTASTSATPAPSAPAEDPDARKRRIQREQEAAALGEMESMAGEFARVRLEVFHPETEKEFSEFHERVSQLIRAVEKNFKLYKPFVARLMESITTTFNADELEDLSKAMHQVSTKRREQKANSAANKEVDIDRIERRRASDDDDDDDGFM
jgi:hypothetical protein